MNCAIVIGIDEYGTAELQLRNAVPDALRFTDWVLQYGGVAEANLHVLLSPKAGTNVPRAFEPATRDKINDVIDEFLNKAAGQGCERLFFYFAGHGLSSGKTASGRVEPALLPADIGNLDTQGYKLLPLASVLDDLAKGPPAEQFFFIDACRDLVRKGEIPLGSLGIVDRGHRQVGTSEQFILYATCPGAKAYESTSLGAGVFTDFLLQGLRGVGAAKHWDAGATRYRVSLSRLVSFVANGVENRVRQLQADPKKFQKPRRAGESGKDPMLAELQANEVTAVQAQIVFTPADVGKLAKVEAQRDARPVAAAGPPLASPCVLDLMPREYAIVPSAPGYAAEPPSDARDVYEPATFRFAFSRVPGPPPTPPRALGGPDGGGGANMAFLDLDFAARSVEMEPRLPGTIKADAEDSYAPIEIVTSEGRPVAAGIGTVTAFGVPPGFYRVRIRTPDGASSEKLVSLNPGEQSNVTLAHRQQIPAATATLLRHEGFKVEDARIEISENFGPTALVDYATVLSMAALVGVMFSRGRPVYGFHHLESLGLARGAQTVGLNQAGLEIVLGAEQSDSGADAPDVDWGRGVVRVYAFQSGHVTLAMQGRPVPAPQAAGVQEFFIPLAPGAYLVEIDLDGFLQQTFAVCALPDRCALLVLVARADGGLDVRQFLPSCDPSSFSSDVMDPHNLLRLDLAQRYYAASRDIPPYPALDDLLWGKWLDPLLGAMAGYLLLGKDKDKERSANRPAWNNMVNYFPGLPDSHIVRGSFQDNDEDMLRALSTGLPVFAEGVRRLYRWTANRFPPESLRVGDPHRDTIAALGAIHARLAGGSVWTTVAAAEPVPSWLGSTPPPMADDIVIELGGSEEPEAYI